MSHATELKRETIFISKATPGDDEFVLWLAPRLESAGYTVFADILTLEPGDRWRKQVTSTLQNRAVKMLLCCRDATLEKNGVQEEIGIAEDLVKELNDPRFIIPLRLEVFKKIFGIGELQFIDFVGSWASGLRDLLDTLERQDVPRSTRNAIINPNWENYKRRQALKVEAASENLTTNWLRVASIPDVIHYYHPPGAIDHSKMERACQDSPFPAEIHRRGFFSFGSTEEVNEVFANVGQFVVHSEHRLCEVLQAGGTSPEISPRDARNLIITMFRKSWENFCRSRCLHEYGFSRQTAFHVTQVQIPLGKKLSWGPPEQRRSAMLRNSKAGRVWQWGISATPSLWPIYHFKLKSRVVFAALKGEEAGEIIKDVDEQHRLRRTLCRGWRNKAWHGRFMAFVALIADGSSYIDLPLSPTCAIRLDANPLRVTAPFTTALPDTMAEDAEEQDPTTLETSTPDDDDHYQGDD
jgi:hypothetical protein